MSESPYPSLKRFFSAYFHPDWREQSSTPDEVVARYVSEATPEERKAAASELDALLVNLPPDDALASFFVEQLGCYHYPRNDAQAAKRWLKGLQPLLKPWNPDER